MNKSDLINALSVMQTVMKKAGLVHEPAQLMIDDLNNSEIYFDTHLQRAFIAGWLSNCKSISDFNDFDFEKAYNNFKVLYCDLKESTDKTVTMKIKVPEESSVLCVLNTNRYLKENNYFRETLTDNKS